ncbi:4958_t:CDS:2 [Entrophospora sp. SA101]|nr:16890_t:CDS:2 [Entrophospora sp. SA101]CAJ0897817.1 4958_t:CDS:2 [Entrophospora sp. SA101]
MTNSNFELFESLEFRLCLLQILKQLFIQILKQQLFQTLVHQIVYLQHGLFDSTDTWLLNGPEHSLPYILKDNGYDVWLGNSRGNQYSEPSSSDEYDFSWDEMAKYDLPAFINYIKKQTNVDSLSFIGAIEILASLIIESISPTDLQCIVLIAPPAILKNQKSKVIKLLSKIKADNLIKILPVKLFKNTLDFSRKLIEEHSLNYNDSFKFIFGETKLLENSNFPGHFPAPASNQNLVHWIQSSRSGLFQRYQDKSTQNNKSIYDISIIPPNSLKLATIVGTNDLLATPENVSLLNQQLEMNNNLTFTKTFEGYAHMDFCWSLDAKDTIYPDIINFLNENIKKI